MDYICPHGAFWCFDHEMSFNHITHNSASTGKFRHECGEAATVNTMSAVAAETTLTDIWIRACGLHDPTGS